MKQSCFENENENENAMDLTLPSNVCQASWLIP